MRPESPTPFPLPEIIRSPDNPPILLDYDLHPQPLSQLIENIRENRRTKLHKILRLRRITIQGGLVKQHVILGKPEVYQVLIHSKAGMSALFDATYRPEIEGSWLAGSYEPSTQTIYLNPDTLFLAQIVNMAEMKDGHPPEESSLPNLIRNELRQKAGQFLIEEIEHSTELMSFFAPILPIRLIIEIIERKAESKRLDPSLQELAQQTISVRPLIPDEQLLELYDIARDRYRLLYSRNDSGIQEKLL